MIKYGFRASILVFSNFSNNFAVQSIVSIHYFCAILGLITSFHNWLTILSMAEQSICIKHILGDVMIWRHCSAQRASRFIQSGDHDCTKTSFWYGIRDKVYLNFIGLWFAWDSVSWLRNSNHFVTKGERDRNTKLLEMKPPIDIDNFPNHVNQYMAAVAGMNWNNQFIWIHYSRLVSNQAYNHVFCNFVANLVFLVHGSMIGLYNKVGILAFAIAMTWLLWY